MPGHLLLMTAAAPSTGQLWTLFSWLWMWPWWSWAPSLLLSGVVLSHVCLAFRNRNPQVIQLLCEKCFLGGAHSSLIWNLWSWGWSLQDGHDGALTAECVGRGQACAHAGAWDQRTGPQGCRQLWDGHLSFLRHPRIGLLGRCWV